LLNLFPQPNGAVFGDGTAQFIGVTPRKSNGDFFTVKVDHQLSASDSLSVRYLFDKSDVVLPRFFPQFPNQAFNSKTLATIEERKFIGANIVNEARFGFNRSTPQEVVVISATGDISFIAGNLSARSMWEDYLQPAPTAPTRNFSSRTIFKLSTTSSSTWAGTI